MKQYIIILEGHDCAGKTHIAAALSKKLNIPVFKAQRDKRWWDPMVNLLYYTEGVTQFIEQTKCSVILDRWHPSDFMYSKLFNRDISYAKIHDIDKRLSNLNTLIVYCYKKDRAYIEDKEDAEFVNKSMYSRMTSLYSQFRNGHTACRSMLLDTSDEDIVSQVKKITSQL